MDICEDKLDGEVSCDPKWHRSPNDMPPDKNYNCRLDIPNHEPMFEPQINITVTATGITKRLSDRFLYIAEPKHSIKLYVRV